MVERFFKQNKKLINIDSTLKNLEVKLNETKHCDTLLQELSYSINYHIYDSLLGFDYKIAYFIINHTIIIFEPIDKDFKDNVFITNSFDPLSHFEHDTDNVIELYEKLTGTKLDLELDEEKTEEGTAAPSA